MTAYSLHWRRTGVTIPHVRLCEPCSADVQSNRKIVLDEPLASVPTFAAANALPGSNGSDDCDCCAGYIGWRKS